MKNLWKIVLSLFFIFSVIRIEANEEVKCELYVDQIIKSFSKEMEDEFDLYFCGSGGRMPYNVEKIEVNFIAYWKPTVEKAREVEISGIKKLLQKVNSHEGLRNFLKKFPFTSNHLDVSISFQDREGIHRADGSVALIYLAKNKIFFERAEIKPEKTNPLIDAKTGKIEYITQPASQKLVTFKEEAYEDAVKMVEEASKRYRKI